MGMYNEVFVEPGFELPGYPEGAERQFQTKDIEPRRLHKYRITGSGDLEVQKQEKREKTDGEKLEEAEERGFESWDEYVEWHEEKLEEDSTALELFLERDIPPLGPSEQKVERTWWEPYSYTGTLNFYNSSNLIDSINESYSYIAEMSNGTVENVHQE